MPRAGAVRRLGRAAKTRRPSPRGKLLPNGITFARRSAAPLAVVAAPVLAFAVSSTARDWALSALGYGLIPVALYVICFLLVLRYRATWATRFWRLWLVSALLLAASLGIMSMFHASSGVMKEASLAGNWGQYFGGSPIPLGALKVAVLVLLVPPLLRPRGAIRMYGRAAIILLRPAVHGLQWLSSRIQAIAEGPATVGSGKEETRSPGRRLLRKLSISVRRSRRSLFGVPASKPAAHSTKDRGSPETLPAAVAEGKAKAETRPHGWQLPSLELLNKGENRPVSPAVLQQMAQHIEATLGEHRVDVAVQDIRTGPRVIRFGLVPGWMKKYRESKGGKLKGGDVPAMEMSRVKVQSILIREKDLALALRTPYLRLEAPVPGESLVGLEVPNPYPRTVAIRSIAESQSFQKIAAKGGLPVALGEDTGGEALAADLSDLPHLLIAGATGSGKSVCINAVVASLLLTNRPDRLRMLMVDPKRVELTPFNGIPHLIAPVIVDTDEVLAVLKAVQNEMLRRYQMMEERSVRNIEGYNKKAAVPMPFLVIIIDELADLMMAAAYEVEQALVRLAQLGRATGIHLILATQRPSVNVVTGLLKANVPSRIAFAVASQVDSRVILDSVGAEKLLGKGDMLLLTSDSPKPQRVQGTFVDDREIEKLVEFWKIQSGPPLPQIPLDERPYSGSAEVADDPEDELLDRARELAERYRHISPSVIQRRLQVGYPKAVQLMELLEEEGLTSPSPEPAAGGPSRRRESLES